MILPCFFLTTLVSNLAVSSVYFILAFNGWKVIICICISKWIYTPPACWIIICESHLCLNTAVKSSQNTFRMRLIFKIHNITLISNSMLIISHSYGPIHIWSEYIIASLMCYLTWNWVFPWSRRVTSVMSLSWACIASIVCNPSFCFVLFVYDSYISVVSFWESVGMK